jgi:exodeoxyribonuclease VII small subunit
MRSKKADSYIKNYQKLKKIAETMRDIDEPDIDGLVAMVGEATDAYKNCQARIDAVEKALALTDEK